MCFYTELCCEQTALLSVLEAVTCHHDTVISFADVITDSLMPALAAAVGANVSGDMRFSCLKVLGDVIAILLCAPTTSAAHLPHRITYLATSSHDSQLTRTIF